MANPSSRAFALLIALGATGAAHADYVGSLGSIAAPAAVAFSDSTATNLALSTGSLPAPYNFMDRWNFTLAADANVASLAAAFKFTDANGVLQTFGIDNLQVNLLNASLGVVATGWQTVTTNGPFTQTIAITPSAGLVAGDYSLQVRGQMLAPPAAYSGSLIAAAPTVVPLPAALPMLLLGLGAFGATGRRARKNGDTA